MENKFMVRIGRLVCVNNEMIRCECEEEMIVNELEAKKLINKTNFFENGGNFWMDIIDENFITNNKENKIGGKKYVSSKL